MVDGILTTTKITKSSIGNIKEKRKKKKCLKKKLKKMLSDLPLLAVYVL